MRKEIHEKLDVFLDMMEADAKRYSIADAFDLPLSYVSAVADFCGLDFKTNKGWTGKNAIRADNIRRDKAAGLIAKVIAHKYGVCTSTVYNITGGRNYKKESL